jgi:alpha-D-xyloside xylohydrolase
MAYRPLLLPYVTWPGDAPDLPVRKGDGSGDLQYIVKASLLEEQQNSLLLQGVTQTGVTMHVSVRIVAAGIVRVLLEEPTPDPKRVTLAKDLSQQEVPVSKVATDQQIKLLSDSVQVHIDLDPFRISFYNPDGKLLLDQNPNETDVQDRLSTLPFGFSVFDGQRVAFHDSFTAEPDEHFYGFGEKFTDFDKRGQLLKMWQYDAYGAHREQAYKNVPFFISTRNYGIFVDSLTQIHFDMAASNHALSTIIVPDTALDYYVIVGPDPKSIITRYASLVSFPNLPPKWSLGLWMSSGFQNDGADKVLERAHQLREHDIPCDVLHLDCYWQRHGRWSEMLWDREMFPDPEGLIAQVKALGFKVCLWMNSYIGIESERFQEAKEQGYLLKNALGEAYVADLWGGYHPPVGILDVTNPDAVVWFKELLRPHLRMGVDVYKTDFGEGVPVDAHAYNGMTGERLHNLYPLLFNDLVAEVTEEITGHSGLVWGRSTYAGGQRHAAQWGGDPNSTFSAMASTLRGGLSMAMCGHAFWSHDIGGFHRQPTPELYVRWAQFGLFSPLSRAHGMTTRLPWGYGDEALHIFRDYVRLRYHLLPYIYTYAIIASETSLPIIRPMELEFPDDPNTYTMDLQYLFGEDILVAPIYNSSGQRPIYLPEGRWIDFWTHEILEGPRTYKITAPLERLPLYVRANALIPTIEPAETIKEAPFEQITVDAYLLEQGSFTLRDIDGTTQITAELTGTQLSIHIEGAKRELTFRLLPLPGTPIIEHVYVNGSEVTQQEVSANHDVSPNTWSRLEYGSISVSIDLAQL